MDLERQIKYLEEEIRVAELYPTDTAQFYAALERSKQKLRELKLSSPPQSEEEK